MAFYKQYFMHFRTMQEQLTVPIQELHGRLYVPLGMWKNRFRKMCLQTFSEWTEESELAEAFAAAGHIFGLTGFKSAMFRGQVAFDACAAKFFGGGDCSTECDNLDWTPAPGATSEVRNNLQLLVDAAYSFTGKIENPCVVMVQGGFRFVDMWGTPTTMRKAFVKGYMECEKLIKAAEKRSAEEVEELLDSILAMNSNWKKDTGFEKPAVFELDSMILWLPVILSVWIAFLKLSTTSIFRISLVLCFVLGFLKLAMFIKSTCATRMTRKGISGSH